MLGISLSKSPPSNSKLTTYDTPQPNKLKAADSFKQSGAKSNLVNAGMMQMMPTTPMAADAKIPLGAYMMPFNQPSMVYPNYSGTYMMPSEPYKQQQFVPYLKTEAANEFR
jgi:hypothetical protein